MYLALLGIAVLIHLRPGLKIVLVLDLVDFRWDFCLGHGSRYHHDLPDKFGHLGSFLNVTVY